MPEFKVRRIKNIEQFEAWLMEMQKNPDKVLKKRRSRDELEELQAEAKAYRTKIDDEQNKWRVAGVGEPLMLTGFHKPENKFANIWFAVHTTKAQKEFEEFWSASIKIAEAAAKVKQPEPWWKTGKPASEADYWDLYRARDTGTEYGGTKRRERKNSTGSQNTFYSVPSVPGKPITITDKAVILDEYGVKSEFDKLKEEDLDEVMKRLLQCKERYEEDRLRKAEAERIEREQAEEEERLVREAKERAEKREAEQARAEEEMKLLREQGFLSILKELQSEIKDMRSANDKTVKEIEEMKNLVKASRAVSETEVVHQADSPNS